jgi:tRNA-splicing ligase RtcB
VGEGYGTEEDLIVTEGGGRLEGADPSRVSDRAITRGYDQCGTLGSGNHFLEVQVVDRVLDQTAAEVMGIHEGQITVLIHSGSRGLGYQVCDDYLATFKNAPKKYGFELPDWQLACAPVRSPEGAAYLSAMRAAANFAWCNRQLLAHQAREVFAKVFGKSWQKLGMELVYDVAHNIAKFEDHQSGPGESKQVCVHRKGATRAFPAGHPDVPAIYQGIGQPVIIPGSMGTASWLLVGQPGSMERSFGTTCHGAGRLMSRTSAVKLAAGRKIDKELADIGILARARGHKGLAEEQPAAYKDVDHVVDVVDALGISKKVARLRPVGVIKG